MAADSPPTPRLDKEDYDETKPDAQASKRRKVVHKTVVRVKMEANVGKQKNEGPPSDFWSWRKYGQKPIKGSPYPRGYYRCSTSKGCSAKKQVERCKTEASVLVITYTSTHNHPGPDINSLNPTTQPPDADDDDPGETTIAASPAVSAQEEEPEPEQEQEQDQDQEQEQERHLDRDRPTHVAAIDEENPAPEDPFHYLRCPTNCSSQDLLMEQEHTLALQLHVYEEPLVPRYRHDDDYPSGAPAAADLPREPEEGHDFFDELEELPAFSHFANLKRSNCFFDDRIPVVPS